MKPQKSVDKFKECMLHTAKPCALRKHKPQLSRHTLGPVVSLLHGFQRLRSRSCCLLA